MNSLYIKKNIYGTEIILNGEPIEFVREFIIKAGYDYSQPLTATFTVLIDEVRLEGVKVDMKGELICSDCQASNFIALPKGDQ